MNASSLEIENIYLDILRAVKLAVHIPVAVKLSPFFSNTANMAKRLDATGADGLVLFNRFYQPDIDLDNLVIQPNVLLSTPQDLRLPLTWIGILYARVKASLAATKATRVVAMAGRVRRITTPAVTPRAKAKASSTSGAPAASPRPPPPRSCAVSTARR